MKEIEILVEVYDEINKIKEALKGFKYVGLKHTIDEYYYDPKREELKPDTNRPLDCYEEDDGMFRFEKVMK